MTAVVVLCTSLHLCRRRRTVVVSMRRGRTISRELNMTPSFFPLSIPKVVKVDVSTSAQSLSNSAFLASPLAKKHPTEKLQRIEHVSIVCVQPLQSCPRPLVFHCHRAPYVVTYSDAAWAVRRRGDAGNSTGQGGPLSLLSWRSGRCRRIARSSLSAEVKAAGEAQEEREYVRLVIVDLLFQDANMCNANDQNQTLTRSLSS